MISHAKLPPSAVQVTRCIYKSSYSVLYCTQPSHTLSVITAFWKPHNRQLLLTGGCHSFKTLTAKLSPVVLELGVWEIISPRLAWATSLDLDNQSTSQSLNPQTHSSCHFFLLMTFAFVWSWSSWPPHIDLFHANLSTDMNWWASYLCIGLPGHLKWSLSEGCFHCSKGVK